MTVTIDGPAGSGKSTLASRIALEADLFYVNSGSFYRTVTLGLYRKFGQSLGELLDSAPDKLAESAAGFKIELQNSDIYLDGLPIPAGDLRTDTIDGNVARVSAIISIREQVNRILVDISKGRDIIAEGRDMSTVVFPDAELQFYFDASIEARARRRLAQGTSNQSFEQLVESIRNRDEIDQSKEVGALKVSPRAVYLETSDLTIEQVCEIVLRYIQEHKISSGVQ